VTPDEALLRISTSPCSAGYQGQLASSGIDDFTLAQGLAGSSDFADEHDENLNPMHGISAIGVASYDSLTMLFMTRPYTQLTIRNLAGLK
jgi:hypothetical protein